ncbi:hypothetical protein PCE1_003998 [Barthelona sp. PCE]
MNYSLEDLLDSSDDEDLIYEEGTDIATNYEDALDLALRTDFDTLSRQISLNDLQLSPEAVLNMSLDENFDSIPILIDDEIVESEELEEELEVLEDNEMEFITVEPNQNTFVSNLDQLFDGMEQLIESNRHRAVTFESIPQEPIVFEEKCDVLLKTEPVPIPKFHYDRLPIPNSYDLDVGMQFVAAQGNVIVTISTNQQQQQLNIFHFLSQKLLGVIILPENNVNAVDLVVIRNPQDHDDFVFYGLVAFENGGFVVVDIRKQSIMYRYKAKRNDVGAICVKFLSSSSTQAKIVFVVANRSGNLLMCTLTKNALINRWSYKTNQLQSIGVVFSVIPLTGLNSDVFLTSSTHGLAIHSSVTGASLLSFRMDFKSVAGNDAAFPIVLCHALNDSIVLSVGCSVLRFKLIRTGEQFEIIGDNSISTMTFEHNVRGILLLEENKFIAYLLDKSDPTNNNLMLVKLMDDEERMLIPTHRISSSIQLKVLLDGEETVISLASPIVSIHNSVCVATELGACALKHPSVLDTVEYLRRDLETRMDALVLALHHRTEIHITSGLLKDLLMDCLQSLAQEAIPAGKSLRITSPCILIEEEGFEAEFIQNAWKIIGGALELAEILNDYDIFDDVIDVLNDFYLPLLFFGMLVSESLTIFLKHMTINNMLKLFSMLQPAQMHWLIDFIDLTHFADIEKLQLLSLLTILVENSLFREAYNFIITLDSLEIDPDVPSKLNFLVNVLTGKLVENSLHYGRVLESIVRGHFDASASVLLAPQALSILPESLISSLACYHIANSPIIETIDFIASLSNVERTVPLAAVIMCRLLLHDVLTTENIASFVKPNVITRLLNKCLTDGNLAVCAICLLYYVDHTLLTDCDISKVFDCLFHLIEANESVDSLEIIKCTLIDIATRLSYQLGFYDYLFKLMQCPSFLEIISGTKELIFPSKFSLVNNILAAIEERYKPVISFIKAHFYDVIRLDPINIGKDIIGLHPQMVADLIIDKSECTDDNVNFVIFGIFRGYLVKYTDIVFRIAEGAPIPCPIAKYIVSHKGFLHLFGLAAVNDKDLAYELVQTFDVVINSIGLDYAEIIAIAVDNNAVKASALIMARRGDPMEGLKYILKNFAEVLLAKIESYRNNQGIIIEVETKCRCTQLCNVTIHFLTEHTQQMRSFASTAGHATYVMWFEALSHFLRLVLEVYEKGDDITVSLNLTKMLLQSSCMYIGRKKATELVFSVCSSMPAYMISPLIGGLIAEQEQDLSIIQTSRTMLNDEMAKNLYKIRRFTSATVVDGRKTCDLCSEHVKKDNFVYLFRKCGHLTHEQCLSDEKLTCFCNTDEISALDIPFYANKHRIERQKEFVKNQLLRGQSVVRTLGLALRDTNSSVPIAVTSRLPKQ